jgi:abhydrolase domain-containing protein 12
VAGIIPILGPLRTFPFLFNYLTRFIRDKWPSKDRIAQYIRANEANKEKYRLTIIHAEDDYDIPSHHTPIVFWNAVNASLPMGISYEDLEVKRRDSLQDLGAAGSMMQWKTQYGVIREEILKTGLHDVVMGYPVITMAVMRIFNGVDPLFAC